MPGWHEATRKLREDGRLQMAGIIQEQHPDRVRLFMQWKKMGWPVLVDSLDLLEVPYVPITLEIDEYGIVRGILPPMGSAAGIGENFVDRSFEAPPGPAGAPPGIRIPDLDALQAATRRGTPRAWRDYADALTLWGGPERLGEAIAAYRKAIQFRPDDGAAHFRLGVAYRKRHDSAARRTGDFRQAVESWTAALDTDPNQYIWRRRIQQYGPRLDKPYPFYDWVEAAREEIRTRGETPVTLVVEPGGAELADPAGDFETGDPARPEPDPEGRIHRDRRGFIVIDTAVVPDTRPSETIARVHISMRPDPAIRAHWNNEAGDLEFWVNPPEGWSVDRQHIRIPNPPETVSRETRRIEFEVRGPTGALPEAVSLSAYALYYVCEDVKGRCLYRRRDIEIRLP